MRKLLSALVVCLCMSVPFAARAGIIVEGSLGKGGTVKPDKHWNPTNVMVAPGVTLLADILRLQLGLVGDVPDVQNSKFDLQLRPMLTVKPPILPLHVRAIFAVQSLIHDVRVAYGGAVGLNISLFGIGVFAEAGLLPTSINSEINWVIEGRVGASVAF